jgi:DNA mismatch repair protein MutS
VPALRAAADAFADGMRQVRRYQTLVEKQYYKDEKQRWLLDAAAAYCEAVSALRERLVELAPKSRGLRSLRDFLAAYTGAEPFGVLASEQAAVRDGLERVRYVVRIKNLRVTVSRYHGEPDYSVEVEKTFERFRRGAAEDHLVEVPDSRSSSRSTAATARIAHSRKHSSSRSLRRPG